MLLGDLANLQVGVNTHGNHLFGRGEVPVHLASYKHIQGNRITDDLEPTTVPQTKDVERYQVQAGDVVLACRGAEPKVALVPDTDKTVVLTSMLIAIRPRDPVDGPLIYGYMRSTPGQARLKTMNQGATSMLSLSTRTLQEMTIPMPPNKKTLANLILQHDAWEDHERLARDHRLRLMDTMIAATFQEDPNDR
jgi:type I restriction enzyme M protein